MPKRDDIAILVKIFVTTFLVVLYFGWIGTWLSRGYPLGEEYYWKVVIGFALGFASVFVLVAAFVRWDQGEP